MRPATSAAALVRCARNLHGHHDAGDQQQERAEPRATKRHHGGGDLGAAVCVQFGRPVGADMVDHGGDAGTHPVGVVGGGAVAHQRRRGVGAAGIVQRHGMLEFGGGRPRAGRELVDGRAIRRRPDAARGEGGDGPLLVLQSRPQLVPERRFSGQQIAALGCLRRVERGDHLAQLTPRRAVLRGRRRGGGLLVGVAGLQQVQRQACAHDRHAGDQRNHDHERGAPKRQGGREPHHGSPRAPAVGSGGGARLSVEARPGWRVR